MAETWGVPDYRFLAMPHPIANLTEEQLDQRAREMVATLESEYARAYYSGIICERRATAHLKSGAPAAAAVAAEWLREATGWYETAEALRPEGNDEAILRWNTCVRLLERYEPHGPPRKEAYEAVIED